jgi:uncharacterized protein (TIGR00270 family)
MPECEICGKKRGLVRAVVEDTVIYVCEDCSSFGKKIAEPRPITKIEETPIEDILIDPSYATIVRLKREALNMKIEELAKKINERVSTIKRIEQGRMHLDAKTAKKLEKVFGIKLIMDYEKK